MVSAALPDPVPRRPVHTRRISFEGFLRDDGLWDLDCRLVDTKALPMRLHERGDVPPGEPIHDLCVRLTIDDGFTIRAVATATPGVPFRDCQRPADAPMQRLVGLTMGPGWRRRLEGAIGGTAGCTHLRELVFNAATAAYQMIPGFRDQNPLPGQPPRPADQPPFYLGKCSTWAFEGEAVAKYFPQFHRKPAMQDE